MKINTILFIITCFLQIAVGASNRELNVDNNNLDSISALIRLSTEKGDKVESIRLMKEKGEMLHSQGFYDSVLITMDNAILLSNHGRDTTKYPATRELYMDCLNIKSGSLSYLSRYEDAINCCIKVDRYNDRHNMLYKAKFLNSMGVVFGSSSKLDQALEYYRLALKTAKKIKQESDRNKQLFTIQINLGGVFTRKSEFDSAKFYLMEAQKLALLMKEEKKEAVVLYLFGFLYSNADKPSIAISYHEEAYKLAVENKMYFMVPFIKLDIARHYIQTKNYEKAFEMANEILSVARDRKMKKVEYAALKILSKIYRNKKDFEQAFFLLEKSGKLKDSLFSQQNERQVMQQKQNFDLYQIEMEKEILNKNSEISDGKRTITNLIAIFSIIIFTCVLMWFIYKLYLQYKLNVQMRQQHDEDINALKDEKRVFEDKIVRKDKDLSRYMVLMSKMNETGFDILSKLKILRSHIPAKSKGYEVINEIEKMINGFKFEENRELDDINQHFDSVSSELYYKLECRYPDLTLSERRMCGLISLGLSNKELLNITGKSQGAISNIKLRIRRKMEIDSAVDLREFLSQI